MTGKTSKSFAMAGDGVDPKCVPSKILYTGASMPAIGLGTFGSDRFSGESIAQSVIGAAEVGYRHFDCAAVYGNEHLIGKSLQVIMGGGVRREELWISSKLWNDKHAPEDVIAACKLSPIIMHRGLTSLPVIPTRSHISTRTIWQLGARWKDWWKWVWLGTSAHLT